MADPKFPIIEAFGYPVESKANSALQARDKKWCPFANTLCEKWRQYRFGCCSVQYSAADDDKTQRVYAVCDHRLDGAPVELAIRDHFGRQADVSIVAEVVLTKPRASFDYVAFTSTDGDIDDVIVIEAQAIDMSMSKIVDGPAADSEHGS